MSNNQDIFKKFGQNSRHILITSQRIAKNMDSGIGTEHLLLALTVTASNLAYDILKENAVNLDQVKMIISLNNIRTNLREGLSREVKDALKLALKKSIELKHNQVEPEHILWSILASKECRAYQIINRIGVNPDDIKLELDDIFANSLANLDKFMEKNLDIMQLGPMGFSRDFEMPTKFSREFAPGNNSSPTPFLDQYGHDLTKMAKEHKLDPMIGRTFEIKRAIQILSRRTKNNPVLVGEPGVGKTAIVEGLAQKIAEEKIPMILKNKKIIALDLTMTVAGTMYRGQFEERIKKILEEVIRQKNIILFIDEIHTVVGAGSAEGSMDAANILKPTLAKGQIHLIGATTLEEYRKHIEKDSALERRLQMIKVGEPSKSEATEILQGIKSKYEEYHNVKISNEAIRVAVELSSQYIADRFLPDKAIDLIDEASANSQISHNLGEKRNNINILRDNLEKIASEKENAVKNQDYEKAAQIKLSEIRLAHKLAEQEKKNRVNMPVINKLDIAQIVCMWTGIPVDSLIETEKKIFLKVEKKLKEKIVGQDEAIVSLAQAIRRAKSGITNPNRPIGTFIFLGPTGVGKTELAKVLASEIFANPNSLIKIDMSEFMEKHNLSRLVGAPPGYVGYEDAGKLTEAVRRHPYSVILLDEIEKAHPEIFNILLQILEDGELTDARGKKINFKNTIIIMTSNIGQKELNKDAEIGFRIKSANQKKQYENKYHEMKETVLTELKREFRPELINRLDKIIVFKPLNVKSMAKIVDLQIKELNARLSRQKINLEVSQKALDYLAKNGYNPKYGARPVKRLISDLLENPISDLIIADKIKLGKKIVVTLNKNAIKITQK